MSEKYNTNINSIEEAIKQLEDLKKDRLSFVTGDKEHDEIYLKDIQAIKIVLGNLEALCDMQKTADRELENAKKINEEHRKENADLMKAINVVEKEKGEWIEACNNLKKKVKERLKKTQKLYEENLKQVDLKQIEKIDMKIFKGIKLEAERDLLRKLLQESEEK